jgi:hypothetical protein
MGFHYLERMATVSEFFEKKGMPAEKPDAVYLLDAFVPIIINGQIEPMSIEDYRLGLIKSARQQISKYDGRADIKVAIEELENFTPAITLRSMPDTHHRIGEVLKTMHVYGQDHFGHVGIPTDRKETISHMLIDVPTSMGDTLANLIAEGVLHDNPHSLNWILRKEPTLVDYDSVHGEPLGLGDKPITMEGVRRDVLQSRMTILRLTADLMSGAGLITVDVTDPESPYISSECVEPLVNACLYSQGSFNASFLGTINDRGATVEGIPIIDIFKKEAVNPIFSFQTSGYTLLMDFMKKNIKPEMRDCIVPLITKHIRQSRSKLAPKASDRQIEDTAYFI